VKLQRFHDNPILIPTTHPWENWLVFNPAVIYDQGKVHMLYRAMGEDGVSRFGYASSTDGIRFQRLDYPIYEGNKNHEFESLGVEDPRLVKIDDLYYVVYTAVSVDPQGEVNPNWAEKVSKRIRVALATTRDFQTFEDHEVIVPNMNAKNASLFPSRVQGEYWLLYRTFKNETFFSHSINLVECSEPHVVFRERPGYWDSVRTGLGSPPIETEMGWFIFYHGVDQFNTYRLGLIVLDKNNPTDVIYRSPEPILEPLEPYEKFGFIPNVVFTCGAVEIDEEFYIYYGAADMTIGLATIPKKELFKQIRLK
jgi:predicted GH43/DUF377 family glycosyl hydrolase